MKKRWARRPATSLARAAALGAALLGLTFGAAAGLSGCGLKGSLYLPQQKKAKVPATVNNPDADATPPPQDNAPAPNPTPTPPEPGSSSPTGSSPRP
jgi:predicted small lipoprotein YifL